MSDTEKGQDPQVEQPQTEVNRVAPAGVVVDANAGQVESHHDSPSDHETGGEGGKKKALKMDGRRVSRTSTPRRTPTPPKPMTTGGGESQTMVQLMGQVTQLVTLFATQAAKQEELAAEIKTLQNKSSVATKSGDTFAVSAVTKNSASTAGDMAVIVASGPTAPQWAKNLDYMSKAKKLSPVFAIITAPEFSEVNAAFKKHIATIKDQKLDIPAIAQQLEKHGITEATFTTIAETQFAHHCGVHFKTLVSRIISYFNKLSPSEPSCAIPLLSLMRCLEEIVFKSENGRMVRATDHRKFAMLVGSLIVHCVLELGQCGEPDQRAYTSAVSRYMYPSGNNADGLLSPEEFNRLLTLFEAVPDSAPATAVPPAIAATAPTPQKSTDHLLHELIDKIDAVAKKQNKLETSVNTVKTEFATVRTDVTEIKSSAVNRAAPAPAPAAGEDKKKEKK